MQLNKYEVQSDATDEAEAEFQASQINQKYLFLEVLNFDTLFRGECKAELYVKLVRQNLHLKLSFWNWK